MKISEENLVRYLVDLSDSYSADSDYMRKKIESAYAQGVRQTVSHVLALLNGEVSVLYMDKESSS
jgi:hypothetical protein